MNFLAGLLLTYLSTQAAAFGVLVILMQERGLRDLYKTDLSVLQVGMPRLPAHGCRSPVWGRTSLPDLCDGAELAVHACLVSGSEAPSWESCKHLFGPCCIQPLMASPSDRLYLLRLAACLTVQALANVLGTHVLWHTVMLYQRVPLNGT